MQHPGLPHLLLPQGRPGAAVYPHLAGQGGLGAAAVPELTHTPSYKDWMAQAGLQFHTEFFDYATDPTVNATVVIANGAQAIGNIQIEQASDFVAEKLIGFVVPLGALFSFQIRDSGLDRQLSNQAILSANGLGSAERPRIIKPRLFRRNSLVTWTFVNLSGGNITRLQVVMSGYKIYGQNSLNINLPIG